jgi:ABC-2 type transport system ATP-binding protein
MNLELSKGAAHSATDPPRGDGHGVPLIEASGLRRTFGATLAVNDVSFHVKRGEILGFLGPNGAGKSTTLRMITGLIAPDKGTARIKGVEISEDPLKARQGFGFLPESIPLYEEMEVIEYLRFIGGARGLQGRQLEDKIAHLSERLGLSVMLKRPCGTLSKGFRQRVGLAQALIHDPEVVILDEPTNGLDPRQIIEVRELITELSKDRAIIFSTHILQEIAAICTRIIVINSGGLIADGTPEDLTGTESKGWQVIVSGSPLDKDSCTKLCLSAGTTGSPGESIHAWAGEGDPNLSQLSAALSENGNSLLGIERTRETLEQVYLRLTGARGGQR